MNRPDPQSVGATFIRTREIGRKDRYQLLTSLVIPRPIGWVSSRSDSGHRNLAPFSYYAALAATPMLVGISIGTRRGDLKDTLRNIREAGAFCVNLASEKHFEAMNQSAGEHPPEVDEFELAQVESAEADLVAAPYVVGSPAVFECRLYREVDLDAAGAMLVIGEVLGIRLDPELSFLPGTFLVDPTGVRPMARLGGNLYTTLGEIRELERP